MATLPTRRRDLEWAILFTIAALPGCWDGRQMRHDEPRAGAVVGVVRRVDDGDTVTLGDGRRVRYVGIDTPESGEPFNKVATAENRRLVGGKTIECRQSGPEATDRYGRYLGVVKVVDGTELAERNVNVALVRAGLASVYVTAADSLDEGDLAALLEAQREALQGRRGFWQERLFRVARLREPLVATRFRIHRESCEEVRSHRTLPIRLIEAELQAGKSFCKRCQPLGKTHE